MKRKIPTLLFSIIWIIYLELIFNLSIFNHLTVNFIYTTLFSIPIALLIFLITAIFNKNLNKVLYFILFSFINALFIAQFIYYQVYQAFISFFSFTTGGQIFQFWLKIVDVIKVDYLIILLFVLPIIILIIGSIIKMFNFEPIKFKYLMLILILAFLVQVLVIVMIRNIDTKDTYSNKNLYYNVHSPLLTAQNIGMLTTFRLDMQRFIFGFEDKALDTNENGEVKQEEKIEYNSLDIDFDYLLQNEKNNNIKTIHKYIFKQKASEKNEYTGMFKGKNLIVFVAEAFSNLAIRKDVTPTLYMLYNTGFQFNNFYTPIFPVSTADGEYITDTSLIPKEGVWSMAKIKYHPYSYANVFEKLGYSSQAYHDHNYNYYDRDIFMNNMGYNSYKACKKGLKINCSRWPESDLEMINATTSEYINDTNFVTYYMTVSGHLNYTRTGNSMVNRNWSKVKNLSYSDKAKGYLSANIELDKAIEELINRLALAGQLENTVIVISGDHYPYGLNLNEINELSGYKRDKVFEMHRSAFLVWNAEMTEPVAVNKIGSSLDILPTILNLFGVSYDSRLLMGRDILSNSDPLVIYSNRSFITDKGRYNSINKTFYPVSNIDENFDSTSYVKNINNTIYDKYKISRMILETNYYKVLENSIRTYTKLKENEKDS